MPNKAPKPDQCSPTITAMLNMHQLFLEALRHREQEVVRYLAILAPAFGGFVWLLRYDGTNKEQVFSTGTIGVILLLLLGAVYSLALGYNYRYITLELAKLESESRLALSSHVLLHWPRTPKEFKRRNKRFWFIPWCTPPEIIKYFWYAFVVGLAAVTHIAQNHLSTGTPEFRLVYNAGWLCTLLAFLAPVWFGLKMRKVCGKEPDDWDK